MKKIKSYIYKIYVLLKLIILNIVVRPFLHRPNYDKKYKLSICVIFKNESRFLSEWILYHQLLGVEHFYLYNNNSGDNYKEVLKKFIEEGIVTLIEWPYEQAQIKAYKDFYENFRHETQWVSFLDIDEFICPRYETNIVDWIKEHDKYPVLVLYWRMFGTAGKLKHDDTKLVIEQYNISWDHLYHEGKCLINTDYDIARYDASIHHCTHVYIDFFNLFRIKTLPFNQFGFMVQHPIHFSKLYNENKYTIQVNHYWSKAWDVYERKMNMTDVFFKNNPKKNLSYFYEHENNNRVSNFVIYRFIIALKLKIKEFYG